MTSKKREKQIFKCQNARKRSPLFTIFVANAIEQLHELVGRLLIGARCEHLLAAQRFKVACLECNRLLRWHATTELLINV